MLAGLRASEVLSAFPKPIPDLVNVALSNLNFRAL